MYRSNNLFAWGVGGLIALLLLCLVGVIADQVAGENTPPTLGIVVDKIHRPAYTETEIEYDKDNLPKIRTIHHDAQYILVVGVQSTAETFNHYTNAQRFYQTPKDQHVTCNRRKGGYTGLTYGWTLSAYQKPNYDPEQK